MQRRVGPTSEQLRQLVEGRYGGLATALYVVPVRHIAGTLLWEGDVHVFHLTGPLGRTEAYAWACPFDGDLHTALQSVRTPGPAEAVRDVLSARDLDQTRHGHVIRQ
jgi:hypothetical protein